MPLIISRVIESVPCNIELFSIIFVKYILTCSCNSDGFLAVANTPYISYKSSWYSDKAAFKAKSPELEIIVFAASILAASKMYPPNIKDGNNKMIRKIVTLPLCFLVIKSIISSYLPFLLTHSQKFKLFFHLINDII